MEYFLSHVCTGEWNAEHDRGRTFDEGVRLLEERFPQYSEAIRLYRDGWYYYKQPLAPDEITEELMTQVIFTDIDAITQNYPGSRFDMQVDAQAVQSENNAGHVLSVVGWPEQ